MEKVRVLIVEDEQLVALDLMKSLEQLGYAVSATVSSAEEAIKSAEETSPSIILMDIKLAGDMDGIDAAAHIHTRLNIPVIYVTSYTDEQTIKRAKATRPMGYLIKPFNWKELGLTIEMALYKHNAEEELRKVNRALKALGSCNKAMTRAADERELLDEICRIIVTVGGYGLAWVGLALDDEQKTVYPAAMAGEDRGFLKEARFSLKDDRIGKSPMGTALRTAFPLSFQHTHSDDLHVQPLAHSDIGYASCIALPLLSEKRVFGVLNIYSSDPGAFDTDEFDLLVELANNLSYGVVSFRDRAERKRAYELIRKSEEKYKNLVELTTDMIYHFNREGYLTFTNDAAFSALECASEEAIRMPFIRWIHPDDREATLAKFREMVEKGTDVFNFENRFLTKKGRVIYALHNIRVLRGNNGEITGTQGIAKDITMRKVAEESLAESEETLRTITGTAKDAIIMIDEKGLVSFWNPAAEKIFGYSYGEIIGREVLQALAPKRYYDAYRKLFGNFDEDGATVADNTIELSARRKDGSEIPIEVSLSSIQIKSKWHNVGIIRDITERKEVEEQLRKHREELAELIEERTSELKKEIAERERAETEVRERESMLRTLFEEALNPVMITAEDGGFLDANRAALRFLECTRSELADKDIWYLLPQEKMDSPHTVNSPLLDGKTLETEYTANGKTKTLLLNIVPVVVSGKRILYFIGQEITEHKKLQEELLKAQKLESVGILAGGIAHDFNNILTSILSNISLARLSSKLKGKTLTMLMDAEKATLRARDLTQQLLTFSKGGAPVKKTASIVQVLRDSADFALRGSNVRCVYHIDDDLWPVEIDEGQISQAVSNLVINADQAMPEGGTLHVKAKNVTLGHNELPNLKGGRYIKVSVEDRGTGIPKKHLGKIFDLYFTTKQEGSGLGLASAYSIINHHGGYLTVESEMGRGTVFHIYLTASKHRLKSAQTAKDKVFRGKGKILVMDDDMDIRESVGEALRLFGYQVAFACDGRETIDIYKQEMRTGEGFDAVIMDLTIPGGMGGVETMKKLRRINPTLKALVSSGYSNSPVMSDYRKYGFSGVITKPYRIENLSKVLHQVISNNG